MRIQDIAPDLTQDTHGIWRTPLSSDISYPDDGNQRCFELEEASFWFNHRNRCITALVKKYPPKGFILDVGGGNGYQSHRLITEGFDVALLEPGPSGALNARTKRQIPTVICATLQDANLRPGSIPAIGLFDVLEHIPDDEDFVDRIYTLLKPGGLFYCAVPVYQWLWSYADDMVHHCRRYSEERLYALLGKRFQKVYFSYYFKDLTLPVFFLRTLPHKVGLSRDRGLISNANEHGARSSVFSKLMTNLLEYEAHLIQEGTEQLMGPSVLFAARKIETD